MNDSKKRHLAEQVKRLRARFVQGVGGVLGDVLPMQTLTQWIRDECDSYRQRIYDPLKTLTLFIEQVLSADHSCQDAVARGLSGRVSLGQAPCSLNTAAYSKARSRLPLGLIERLGRAAVDLLCAQQPRAWCWRGREVKLVDGTTVSMPDTTSNQASFPQSRTQKPGLGFPLARLGALVAVCRGAARAAAASRRHRDCRSVLRGLFSDCVVGTDGRRRGDPPASTPTHGFPARPAAGGERSPRELGTAPASNMDGRGHLRHHAGDTPDARSECRRLDAGNNAYRCASSEQA